MTENPSKAKQVRLPADLHRRTKLLAAAKGTSVPAEAADAIEAWLALKKNKDALTKALG